MVLLPGAAATEKGAWQQHAAVQSGTASVLNPEEQHADGVRCRLRGVRRPAKLAGSVQQPIVALEQTRFSVAVDAIMARLIVWLALMLLVYMQL
jgi:hypothetical protein